jgi:selenoprotein W-related protein
VLKKELGLESQLVVGSSGIFEVAVDGKVVAQRRSWRFPSDEEIVQAVSSALGRAPA